MKKSILKPKNKVIPTQLTEKQFNEFVLLHLSEGRAGPKCKIPLYNVFNYVLKIIHTGMQWHQLPIKIDDLGKPEIHYSRVFRIYQRWANDGSLEKAFEHSVFMLKKK
ncbi:hypothetical protein BH10PSE19_BH10PSE19_13780 [soil metagenome]